MTLTPLFTAIESSQPIVPVKMQGAQWKATEWLGAVTAGLLYTPMHDQTTMQSNLPGLLEQVKGAVGQTVAVTSDVKSPRAASLARMSSTADGIGESEEMEALRSELDNLRQDLAKAVTHSQRQAVAEGSSTGLDKVLAPVPAEVPQLSLNVRPTDDMEKLKRMLLSAKSDDSRTMAVTSTKSTIGAMGMVSDQCCVAAVPKGMLYPNRMCSDRVGLGKL
jgi:hypothetical protein